MLMNKKIISSITGLAATKLLNVTIAFCTSVLLARSLGPDSYGSYIFAMSVIGLISWASCLGLPALLTREIAKYENVQKWHMIGGLIRRSNQFVILTSTVLLLFTFTISILLRTDDELDRWSLLILTLPAVPALGLSSVRSAALRGIRKVATGAIPELIVRPVTFLAFASLMAISNVTSIKYILISQIVSAYVAFAIGVVIFKKFTSSFLQPKHFEYKTKYWLTLLPPFTGIAAVSYLNVEFITLFLGFTGNNEELALFRIAASLSLIVALPLTIVESVAMPYVTRHYHSKNIVALKELTQRASLAAFVISSVPALLLLLYGKQLIEHLYGHEYAYAYGTMLVIVLGYLLVNLIGLSMQLLYATEFQDIAFRISLFGAFITILTCVILIPVFGQLGAGIALGFGKFLRALLFVRKARQLLKIKTSLIW